ncbi:hypothetical protein J2T13_002458 [Paenibacillus sp. DS2015]
MGKMGVETIYVTGYAGVNGYDDIDKYELLNYKDALHAWNLVKLDSKYYHLDTTWNQGSINEVPTTANKYNYFLVSDEQIANDHIWRKGFYPKSQDDSYNPQTVKDLKTKGYPIISGEITLQGNANAKEDIWVDIAVRTIRNKNLSFNRIMKLDKGTNSKSFSLAIGKEFANEDLTINGSNVTLDAKGYYSSALLYNTVIEGGVEDFKVILEPNHVNVVKGKMIVPDGITIESRLDFGGSVTIYRPTETGGFSLGENDMITFSGNLQPGDREAQLEFNSLPPEAKYYYTIKYNFAETYAGETLVQLPVQHSGTVDHTGNIVAEDHKIDGSKYPLEEVIIKLSKNKLWIPTSNQTGKVTVDGTAIKEIKEKLKEHHMGSHAALKKLKTINDAQALEKAKPVEVDSNGTIYYSENTASGIEVFRSYSKTSNPEALGYNITLNKIYISKEDYLGTIGELNEFLKNSLNEKKLADIYVYTSGEGSKKLGAVDKSALYNEILKGYAQINISYKKDNITYTLSIYGSPYDKSISVSIRTNIAL